MVVNFSVTAGIITFAELLPVNGGQRPSRKGGGAMNAIIWWWLGLILFLYLIF